MSQSQVVERMIQSGTTPFCINLQGINDIEQAMDKAKLNYNVKLGRLFTDNNIELPNNKVTIREDNNKILGIVGNKYSILQNKDAFKFFEPFLDAGLATLESAGQLFGGKKVVVLARLNTQDMEVEPGDIVNKYSDLEIFVKIDKNLFDNDLDLVKDILLQLDKLRIAGVFFYDLAILQFKQELSLKLSLVWSQTHMVTNMKTCDYYYEQGVSFALLSKEITLEEIVDISKKSKIKSIVEVVSLPSVGYSRRKLVHNYYEDLGEEEVSPVLSVLEKITNKKYLVKEEDCGTGFYLDEVLNGTGVIKALYEAGVEYILFRE